MAGSSLLALIDDIATLLDDIASMSQIAAQKTVAVVGDDLALSAEQVAGITADRELPVVWAVAVGSIKNKLILVPTAMAISAFLPWAVIPLLMVGGVFLCYEGFEKILHATHNKKAADSPLKDTPSPLAMDPVTFEKSRIQGAIRTDFVLSAEIITITLGSVALAPLGVQLMVLILIALLMTVGVYGLVAGIVKIDDGGLYLSQRPGDSLTCKVQRGIGKRILQAAPYLMKGLSMAGTVAMFMVGGNILMHGLPGSHDLYHWVSGTPLEAGLWSAVAPKLLDTLAGMMAGAISLMGMMGVKHALWVVRKRP
ncbi:DUF808 domain-containing inner membrane protein YedI [Gammaproteobacteria bacterium]